MSLSGSRIKNGLHPWLAEGLQWLEDVSDFYGGSAVYLSGRRTTLKQWELWEKEQRRRRAVGRIGSRARPVAVPGCSQHEYGLAADVFFARLDEGFDDGSFNQAIAELAPLVSLVTVAGDPNHYQTYPGSQFREWAVREGICPDPEFQRIENLNAQTERLASQYDLWASQLALDMIERNSRRLFR